MQDSVAATIFSQPMQKKDSVGLGVLLDPKALDITGNNSLSSPQPHPAPQLSHLEAVPLFKLSLHPSSPIVDVYRMDDQHHFGETSETAPAP